MKSSISLAGIKLNHPVMNGAGTCKLIQQVEGLAQSDVAAIMVGSITLKPREFKKGNWYVNENYSLNSMGMPNPGAEYYQENLPRMAAIAHANHKPLFVSVAGFSPEEFAELAELCFKGGADLVELNLSCSNIWQESNQEEIACFNPNLVKEILNQVEKKVGQDSKVSVKLSPFSDPAKLKEVAEVINQSKVVKAVTTTNTFPNTFALDESGKQKIARGDGLAGLGGPAIKPIGLGQVKQLRGFLRKEIEIIGVGGISSMTDVLDYLQSGAKAVQLVTAYLTKGLEIFTAISREMAILNLKSRELINQ